MARKKQKRNNRKKMQRDVVQHFLPKNYVLNAERETIKVEGGSVPVEAFAPNVKISQHQPNNSAMDDQTSKTVRQLWGLLTVVFIFGLLSKDHRGEAIDPPTKAIRLLTLFLRGNEREAVIGDLVEKYRSKCHELGRKRADRWIYVQVVWSMFALAIRMVQTIGWLILGEWIKKHIS
jgi:hypothetical protein